NVSSKHLGYYFFFQAEDGIRDLTVTGVQTCALPILYFFSSCVYGNVYDRSVGVLQAVVNSFLTDQKQITFLLLGKFQVIYRTVRSEEHTSELQSQSNLVCRLLLEKKKKQI